MSYLNRPGTDTEDMQTQVKHIAGGCHIDRQLAGAQCEVKWKSSPLQATAISEGARHADIQRQQVSDCLDSLPLRCHASQ